MFYPGLSVGQNLETWKRIIIHQLLSLWFLFRPLLHALSFLLIGEHGCVFLLLPLPRFPGVPMVLLENLHSTWCYLLFQTDNYFFFRWLLPDVVTQQLTINGKFSEIKEQCEILLQEKKRGRICTLYSLHFFRIVPWTLELHFLEELKMWICWSVVRWCPCWTR